MMAALTDHQQKVLDAFTKANTDIDIVVIYTRVYGDPGLLSARDMQMKLAPSISAVNAKLTNGCIRPGDTKRTYHRVKTKK